MISNINKNKKSIIIIIVLLLLYIIMLSTYAFLIYKNNINLTKTKKIEEKKKKVKIKLSKCLNTDEFQYSNFTEKQGDYGLTIKINEDRKSAILNVDWKKFKSKDTGINKNYSTKNNENILIDGFSKKIKKSFIGDYGYAVRTILFFIMEDNSIEYVELFNFNKSEYELNVDDKNTASVQKIDEIEDVYKIYNAKVSPTGLGEKKVVGAKKDGTFYDLSLAINQMEEKKLKEELIPLDSNKCINTPNAIFGGYKEIETKEEGLDIQISEDKMHAVLNIDWDKFMSILNINNYENARRIDVLGFQKKIKSGYRGIFGHEGGGNILFLMEDGSVEYIDLFDIIEKDHISTNTITTKQIPNVTDIEEFHRTSFYFENGGGGATTIAMKKDKTFYDLSSLIN